MFNTGQTIRTKHGEMLTILETVRLRNRKKHRLLKVRKTRSGAKLVGEVVGEMTSKALRKIQAR